MHGGFSFARESFFDSMELAFEVTDVLLALSILASECDKLRHSDERNTGGKRHERTKGRDANKAKVGSTCFSMMAVCSLKTLLSTLSLLRACQSPAGT